MAEPSRLHVFGVRHHGPGSAASLVRALDTLDPEEVLIEGPPEGSELIRWLGEGLVPPVAILVYDQEEPRRAVFYPFAEWSPEWQAMRWALARGRAVRFVDFPVAVRLREQAEAEAAVEALLHAEPEAPPAEDEAATAPEPAPPEEPEAAALAPTDPLGRLAAAAGYADGEAWWNSLVEEADGSEDLFAHIEAAMAALRESGPLRDDDERREAHMREAVADALARTTGPVAAVVGAWHAPALRGGVRKGDKAHLKAAKKGAKVAATWVPWTDSRLSFASGYGAGVSSPGWYRALWEARGMGSVRALTVRWQTRVARALRRHDRSAATSSVIDAVRLVEALAALRGLSRPGLDEMRDASLATLCAGEEVPWALVARELLDGTHIGEVPETVPSTPLAADLARQQKVLKLKPEALARELAIDLRSDNGGARSTLLHRLTVLDVPWGRLGDAGSSRGTFRENWVLEWKPELSVKLAEALRWGTTLEAAASAKLSHDLTTQSEPARLAEAVRGALLAGLDGAVRDGVRRIDEVATAGAEVVSLGGAVPPLVDVLRYGTARDLQLEGVDELVSSLLDKVDIGLVHAARHLDAAAAETLRDALATLDPAVRLFRGGGRLGDWADALQRVADDDEAAPLVSGWAVRRLHDQGRLDDERLAARLSATLSPGVPLHEAAAWLEGFLGEAAHILLHDATLLGLVDAWMGSLSEEALVEALPLLRRATSSFGVSERQRLLKMIAGQLKGAVALDVPRSSEAFEAGAALLDQLLGLGEGA